MKELNQISMPQHIAIIMDGNGRWAKQRDLPRAAGHKAGIGTLRKVIETCVNEDVQALTVYAFSIENWRRPEDEVGILLSLFISALNEQIQDLHQNQINIQFIGDLSRFPQKLQDSIVNAEALTAANSGLKFRIAANYGGRWDILNAFQTLFSRIRDGELSENDVDENEIQAALSLADLPEPDLFIRTGGERRISNYLLWQLAYTEMYFSDVHWPDFSPECLLEACHWYQNRQRRFGQTSEQVQ